MRRFILWTLAAVLLALTAAGGWLAYSLKTPHRGFRGSAIVMIERGESTRAIAEELESAGVISHRWLFWAVRGARRTAKLQAGEYEFTRPLSPFEVFAKLERGEVKLHSLTIPEGLTRFEIAGRFARRGFGSVEEFLKETASPARVADLFPEATSLEGCLFPETYRLAKPFSAKQLVDAMVERFRKVYSAEKGAGSAALNDWETLVLASLVEKETGTASERALVSSVFHNRLSRNMRLQCDPTIIYGLVVEDRYRGGIYKEDISDPHPYNTYVHAGLPPGPIANPGRASIRAALRPAESEYLFFVADTTKPGAHVFSDSLRAHNRAVAAYRRASP